MLMKLRKFFLPSRFNDRRCLSAYGPYSTVIPQEIMGKVLNAPLE